MPTSYPDRVDPRLEALKRAVAASPDSTQLRLLLAAELLADGAWAEAADHAARVLLADPADARAQSIMQDALKVAGAEDATGDHEAPEDQAAAAPTRLGARPVATAESTPPVARTPDDKFDWVRAEQEFDNPALTAEDAPDARYQVERSSVTLADVGGLEDVKARLEASFFAPLRHPELRSLYGKRLQGGLLLYGPPGCGKTYLARAVAGEMQANFMSITIAEVLDMWLGNSERNIHDLFVQARQVTPVVVFLDEIDALGGRRDRSAGNLMATVTNQLLHEMDGLGSDNEGVYILAATNRPWDVDPALRRPGRLDRLIFVAPPDQAAREAIFRVHLLGRPVSNLDLAALAKATPGYSGADIAAACETTAEHALLQSIKEGVARPLTMAGFKQALREVRPSTRPWFDTARTVAEYDESGSFSDLRDYMRAARLL